MNEIKQEYAIAKPTIDASVIETVLVGGDLSKLSAQQRTSYYKAVCDSVGLNPLTKPFDYITLNGKLTLYARKDATDQLRNMHGVSITKLEREKLEGIYLVTAYAMRDGRQDSSIGAVNIDNLKGDALANAMMKAETKAKRRVTLSICGLGMLDETELETIPASAIEKPDVTVRPYTPDQLKAHMATIAGKLFGKPANGKRADVGNALVYFFQDKDRAVEFVEWLTGARSMNDVGDSLILAMHKWLNPKFSDTGEVTIDPVSVQELDNWVAGYEDAVEST